MSVIFHKNTQTFHICNAYVSDILCIMQNGQIENLYYGKAIRDKEDFSYGLRPYSENST